MSSEFQRTKSRTRGLFYNNGALRYDPSPMDANTTQATAERASETTDTSLPLRFNSMTLDELSKELDRRTKETQRLREEVENATREALERFHSTSGSSSTPESSANQQKVTHPPRQPVDGLSQELNQRHMNYSPNGAIKKAVDECIQQLSDLQLNETQTQPEQEASTPQAAVTSLLAQLHDVQIERDILSDLRLKDSEKHVDQMEKMLSVLEELQTIKRSTDQKLQETEDEALELNRKVETLECTLKLQSQTVFQKQYGPNCSTTADDATTPRVECEAANSKENIMNEADMLRPSTSKQQLLNEEFSGVKDQDRIQELIVTLGQEMAMLTDKLSSSKASGVRLNVKLHSLRALFEKQGSQQEQHIRRLESTICCHKDKVCYMEQQLSGIQTELHIAQREKDRSLQLANELQCQLNQLQRCCEQQQCELRGEVQVLRGQLESAWEQLHHTGEERTSLQALLEQRPQGGSQAQELLRDKDQELWFTQRESQQHVARLEELQAQCRTLQAEQETLTLKLNDNKTTIGALRLQMEAGIQLTVQHQHTIDSLTQEKILLSDQLNQGKMEIQQLRADLDQHKSDLAAAELERRQLQASVSEHSRRAREEKQQLTTQMELQRMQLETFTEEHKELQRLLSWKKEEYQGVVLKLRSQLRDAHGELHQMRGTMRTLGGADEHGLRVAQDMQREVTARREQVDSMRSRIQHLEGNIEKLYQEKRYQSLEAQRQNQELHFIRAERKQLAEEMEALHSTNQQLRERIGELEAILHQISARFANCQDVIQLREQEFFRLKLQHVLDLKELQGQNQLSPSTASPPDLDPQTSSALPAPPSSQHATSSHINRQQECCARQLGSPAKERRGVISENRRPHTENSGGSHHGRRSAPGRLHGTTDPDEAQEVNAVGTSARRTCRRESHFLRTSEPNVNTINTSCSTGHAEGRPASASKCMSYSQLLPLGRRSPVYTLLTSDPAS